MDKATQAEARIKQVCDSLGVTEGGRLWLDVALDPFKDLVQRPIGYPDRNMAPSVVQTVHDSIDISAPAGFTGNWDCNIFLDSLWKTAGLRLTAMTLPGIAGGWNSIGQEVTTHNRGGLVVRAAPSGNALNINTTQNNLCLPYVTDVFANDTSARILAIGMEVHNTTSELHKQGSVIVYRVADDFAEYPITPFTNSAGSTFNSITYPGIELVDPPQTASIAIDLPGSLQWDAAKGVYVVPIFAQEDNPAQDLRNLIPIERTAAGDYLPEISTNTNIVYMNPNTSQNAKVPITLSGAYFVGLSLESTLTVNLTYYIEQFPSIDSAMKRLAGPSCPEDFEAIELYTKVSRQLPTGVMVNDNFLGAFVSGVSRLIQGAMPYIPRIANFLGGAANALQMFPARAEPINSMISNRNPPTQRPSTTTTTTEIIRQIPQPKPLYTKNNQQIVPYNNRPNPGTTMVKTTTTNNRRTRNQLIKNQRDKSFNRLDKYMKASNAGNKYIK